MRFPTWFKKLVFMVLAFPLTAGEDLQYPTQSAEIQAHVENLQNRPDINPLFRSRLLKILPQIAQGASADIILPGCKGNTALHYACAISDIDLVTTLLRYGASTTIRTHRGALPTDCADGPNRAKIRRLLEKAPHRPTATTLPAAPKPKAEPKPTAKKQTASPTPHASAPTAQPEIEQVTDHLRNIPCAGATEYKHKEALLECLACIKEGKPIDYIPPGGRGNTALHHACAMGDFFLAIWLLEHGANPNMQNKRGQTPMNCLNGPNASFIRTHLIEYGAKN